MDIEKINVGGTQYDVCDTVARAALSDEFSTGGTYAVGDYCIYENTLYKFTAAKEPGAWDASKVAATQIVDELSQLNGKITKEPFSFTFIDNSYSFSGSSYKEDGRVYINGYFYHQNPNTGYITCAFVPQGFRPKQHVGSAGYTDDDTNYNQVAGIKINNNGDITIGYPTQYSRYVYVSIVYDVA